ncbi:hypothetical protein BIBE0010001c01_00005 [Bifidobacterium phage BigBern1]|nr:hypothetical protein BIBE0010001c01_00005 [Bifidobacterium phage BigBern1]
MNNELQAIVIFAVDIVLTVASLIISQVFHGREKYVISSGFIGLAFLFAFVAFFASGCVISTIWPQS